MMHKVVLDTNIFISSVFWDGASCHIVQKAIDNKIQVSISQNILDEIKRVLLRDFNLQKQEIDDVINAVTLFTTIVKPKEKVTIIETDPDDNMVLECALASESEFMVTQDKHLLDLRVFKGIPILHPKDFLKFL